MGIPVLVPLPNLLVQTIEYQLSASEVIILQYGVWVSETEKHYENEGKAAVYKTD